MNDLAALAVESYAHDVQAVVGELAQATDAPTFVGFLRELIELASSGRVLVADGDDEVIVRTGAGTFRLAVEPVRTADGRGIPTAPGRSTPC